MPDNIPFVTNLPSQLVETAVQQLIELMRQRFNTEVDRINDAFAAIQAAGFAGGKINVPKIPYDSYFISEVIEPINPPVCFIIAERSEQDLTAQNVEHGVHSLLMVLLHYDFEITHLVRSSMRMAVAAYRAVHDRSYVNTHFLVRGMDYSPLYRRSSTGSQRDFAKDVVVRVEAHTYESF